MNSLSLSLIMNSLSHYELSLSLYELLMQSKLIIIIKRCVWRIQYSVVVVNVS